MLFYIYQLVEPLILPNTPKKKIESAKEFYYCKLKHKRKFYQTLQLTYQPSAITNQSSANLSVNRYFCQTEPFSFLTFEFF
jgi:hypothetical protein